MTPASDLGTSQNSRQTSATASDAFELDVSLLEVADTAGLISLTDDGCGETCGACTTNVA